MQAVTSVAELLLYGTTIWSVALRGIIWLIISLVIMISIDTSDPDKAMGNLKTNLGFSILFIVLSTYLIVTLFGFYQPPA